MMYIALFLHLYQPPTQDPQITLEITQCSYLKIIELLKKYPSAKITVNLTGSLLEQWLRLAKSENKVNQIIKSFQELHKNGRVELTATAMYHPLLPTLPSCEILRQIQLDQALKKQIFGQKARLPGFFPPEMVYTQDLTKILDSLGFDWIILDESAHPLSSLRGDKETLQEHASLHLGDRVYQIKNSGLKVFFRNREASLKVAFSSQLSLINFFSNLPRDKSNFQILAMDGETFGHHRPGMLSWLEQLFANSFQSFEPSYQLLTISELLQKNLPVFTIEPLTSTWGITIEEPDQSRTFPRWQNPQNPVHNLQWQLYDFALNMSGQLSTDLSSKSQIPNLARIFLDQGLHSDQFWWGSANPCWNLKMVEKGAALLRDSILLNPKATFDEKRWAKSLFIQIAEVGKALYGEEEVSC